MVDDTLSVTTNGQLAVQVGSGGVGGQFASVGSTISDGANFNFNNVLDTQGLAVLYNGATYDRQRGASAANLAAQSGLGAALVAPPGQWSVISTPAAGTQASASKVAGGAGVRHVYAAATFSHGAIAAPVATLLQANVRDGATGAGTVIDAAQAAIQAAVAVTVPIPLSGKNVPGTAATAMTAEYSAALANLAEGATLQGYDVS